MILRVGLPIVPLQSSYTCRSFDQGVTEMCHRGAKDIVLLGPLNIHRWRQVVLQARINGASVLLLGRPWYTQDSG